MKIAYGLPPLRLRQSLRYIKYMSQARYRVKEFAKGAYYHIYNRGVNKDPIFIDDEDYLYYISKMRQFRDKYKVAIIAYSLIENHYHQLLKQLSDVTINKFLLAVNTGYGDYFNKKYNRVGPLTQDRYKQIIMKSDVHLYWMSVYVNCNYEIHGLGRARGYKWTSCQDYLGLRNGTLCDKDTVMGKFGEPKKYESFCDKLIVEFKEKNYWKNLYNETQLGTDGIRAIRE